jgi:hypothetical protein
MGSIETARKEVTGIGPKEVGISLESLLLRSAGRFKPTLYTPESKTNSNREISHPVCQVPSRSFKDWKSKICWPVLLRLSFINKHFFVELTLHSALHVNEERH